MKKNIFAIFLIFIIFVFSLIWFIIISSYDIKFLAGWIYIGTVSVSTLFILTYFIITRPDFIIKRFKGVEKRKIQKFVSIFASILFILMILLSSIDHRYNLSHIPSNLNIISDLFVLIGFIIIFVVFKINSYALKVVETNKKQKVIKTSLYSIIRHPMYFGSLLIIIFTPLALDSLYGLIFSFIITVLYVIRIIDEEKLLSEKLDGYKEYTKEVKYRLIPFIW